MTDPKEYKIEFAPGCFDTFDGTQEELDALMAEITRMLHSGELEDKARIVDIDDLMDSDSSEDQRLLEHIAHALSQDESDSKRNLQ
jgi:hypothetical protein